MAVTVNDDDLRARNSIVISKVCYYNDVRFVGAGVPLFDDLLPEVQCKYLDLAESILCALEENDDWIG